MSNGRTLDGLGLRGRGTQYNETGIIVKAFQRPGADITDTPNGTSADRVTGTDVMAALGVVQSKGVSNA
jgi:hypothetical protein